MATKVSKLNEKQMLLLPALCIYLILVEIIFKFRLFVPRGARLKAELFCWGIELTIQKNGCSRSINLFQFINIFKLIKVF